MTTVLGSRKRLLIVATIALVALGGIGGGVYAALGGAGQSQSLSSSPINLDSGLVARYKLDNNVKDSTPYGDDLSYVLNGSATSFIPDRENKTNAAVNFPGQSVFSGNIPAGSPMATTGAVTVSAWLKPATGAGDFQTVLRPSNSENYSLWYDGSQNRLCFEVGTSFTRLYSTANSAPAGQWLHAVVTKDAANTVSFYVNGVLINTATAPSVAGAPTYFFVGGSSGTQYKYYGAIDDLRVYNRAINASEATALYNSYDTTLKLDGGGSKLMAQWKMNGNSKDASPYGNNATVIGALLGPDRKAKAASAYALNGTSTYLDAGTASQLNFDRTDSFSVSAWIKTDSNTTGTTIYLRNSANSVQGYQFYLYQGNRLCINLFANYTANMLQECNGTTTPALSDNTWHFVSFTYGGTSTAAGVKFYMDGVQLTPGSGNSVNTLSASIATSAGVVQIGGSDRSGTVGGVLNGSIDEVRVYGRALSASDEADLYSTYDGGFTVSDLQKGLQLDLPFNGSAKDGTPNGNNGTVSAATPTTDRLGRANSAYSFNGTSSYTSVTDSPSLRAPNAVSMSVWVKPTSITGNTAVALKGRLGGTWDYGLTLINGVPSYVANNVNINLGSALPLNQWSQVTFTIQLGGSLIMYVNGQTVGTFATPTNSSCSGPCLNPSAYPLTIGSANNSSSNYFSGSIDDVRIWNRALSTEEVARAYQSYR